MPRKSVTIQYRRLHDVNNTFAGSSLEGRLRESFNTVLDGVRVADRLGHRVWQRDHGQDNLFSNILYDGGTHMFGDIVHFTHGHLQALFNSGLLDQPEIPVQQLPAPEQMEYVHSIMYWMIIADHAFIVQSQTLRTETVEQYLTWLLKDRTKIIADPGHVLLAAKFDPATVGGGPSDIKEIVIGGIVSPAARPGADQPERVLEVEQAQELTAARRGTRFGQARAVLAALFGGQAEADAYLRDVPADADLSVEVHIGYKTRKRRVSRAPLAALETGLRNMADGDIRVTGKSGDRLPTGDVRLHQTAMIEADGSLLVPGDVRDKMLAVYRSFVELGKIAA